MAGRQGCTLVKVTWQAVEQALGRWDVAVALKCHGLCMMYVNDVYKIYIYIYILVVGLQHDFDFSIYWEYSSQLTNIFQLG